MILPRNAVWPLSTKREVVTFTFFFFFRHDGHYHYRRTSRHGLARPKPEKNNRSDNKPGGSQEVAILVTFASLFQSTGIFYHLQLFSHSFLVLLGHESTKANLPGRKLDLVRNYFWKGQRTNLASSWEGPSLIARGVLKDDFDSALSKTCVYTKDQNSYELVHSK